MKSRVLACVLCLTLSCGFLVMAAGPSPDDPKPAWRNGPARVILTSDEDKAFKALSTDDERAKWIADFWAKRDPSPGTPQNEYKDDFYKRVDEATAKYREAGTPGWSTERGKLLLIAGRPDSIAGGGGDRETWVYTRPLPGKPSPIKVVFEKTPDDTYSVTEGQILSGTLRGMPPEAVMRFSLGLKEGEVFAAKGGAGAGAAGAPGGAAAGAAAGAPAQPPPLAPGVERLRTAAAADPPVKDLGIEASVRYFKATDGSTDVVIDFEVKRADLTPGTKPVLFASLRASSIPDAKPIELTDQDAIAVVDDPNTPWMQFGFSISVPARPYELRVGLSDGPEGKMGTAVQALQVPDYTGDALMLSSVTSAIPTAAEAGLSPDDPFRLGDLRLIPPVNNVLGSRDDLSFYYQVYNAKKDGGRATLDVAYMLEKKEPKGWVPKLRNPIGEKDQHMEALGYTIPNEALIHWPDGDYRVSITVTDKVGNATANSTVLFTLKK